MSFIDKTHYQLVQGCTNIIIVRKIITIIITMIFLTIMLHLELLKSDQLMSRGRLCPMKNKIGLNLSENTFTVTEMENEEEKKIETLKMWTLL